MPGVGASALEVSHRSPWFEGVIREVEANLRSLLEVPDTHHIVFCQGGATQQFSMVPMNFLYNTLPADVVVTGSWSARALQEATRLGPARAAWSGESDGFIRTPSAAEMAEALVPDAPYAHITTNETIQGVEYLADPHAPGDVPLIADISSDFLSRPLDVARYGLVYAGAQKNAGPAGVTVVIVRDDLLERVPADVPTMLDYRTFTRHGSMYNTPPVFAIYVVLLVTRWLRDEVGGLRRQHAINREKADLLYDAIDASDGFYRGHADAGSRSLMNVTWRLPTPELDGAFVADAASHDLRELKGHRSVGGIRASIYNAMPVDGVRELAAFMRSFAAEHA